MGCAGVGLWVVPWVCDLSLYSNRSAMVIGDVGLCFVVVVDARVCGGSLIAGSGGGGGHFVVGGSDGLLEWV